MQHNSHNGGHDVNLHYNWSFTPNSGNIMHIQQTACRSKKGMLRQGIGQGEVRPTLAVNSWVLPSCSRAKSVTLRVLRLLRPVRCSPSTALPSAGSNE